MKKIVAFITVLALAFIPSIAMAKDSLSKYTLKKITIEMELGKVLELYPDFTLNESDKAIHLSLRENGVVIARADFNPDGELQRIEAYFTARKIFDAFGIHPLEGDVDQATSMKENIKQHVDLMYEHKQSGYQSMIEGDEEGNVFFRNARFESDEVILLIRYVNNESEDKFVISMEKNYTDKKFIAANVELD